ncbi:P-loop ATPase, Sll1717 family [Campylobacter curvus]|uniref:P-loop ATPase, Sll1717 family n=1 Tax=Campylobacter curvus TaxID=200 RepID=UPI000371BC16|nr:hypothetical protein [Campylobacter curvus]QKF62178.1 hypothetical protein CCVT_1945 [Campylobacter curvus]UEB50469.1 hypothetical protein LK426_03180 [Campylobacter curvus]
MYNMKKKELKFNDEEIAALFGSEAAEDEKPERLIEYYFKADIYEEIKANLPLRIAVGHKGIGKSAIFQVMRQEFEKDNILTIMLTPDDIEGINESKDDGHNKLVKIWKDELTKIIINKAIDKISTFGEPIKNLKSSIIDTLVDCLKNLKINISQEKNAITQHFLSDKKIIIFIDDLDRGWEGKRDDIKRISAMLNAIRDISNTNRSINFKISLRTDVYYLYRTNDESTDKVESNVVWVTWDNHGILALLAKRIVTYFGGNVEERELLKLEQTEISNNILSYVFEDRFHGHGKWSNIPIYKLLMSLIRKRPRDLIKLCWLSAKEAKRNNHNKIGTEELNKIFELYSQGRLQDTINEFKSELPTIERLLLNMKPTKYEKNSGEAYQFTDANLNKKVKNIINNMPKFIFANGKEATEKDLCIFMYKINFLTARKKESDGKIIRKYFEENRFLANTHTDFGFDWEIHPSYRWALQPDNILNIFDTLVEYDS